MRVAFDTNVIVRLLAADDPTQLAAARRTLAEATEIILPIVALAEAMWVMRRAYRVPLSTLTPILNGSSPTSVSAATDLSSPELSP